MVPGKRLLPNLRQHHLADFTWITPDVCQDGHDCESTVVDAYLRDTVPQITSELKSGDRLVITYDEGSSSLHGGGKIVTMITGPSVKPHVDPGFYNNYSLLRTLEQHFGLPLLKRARTADPISFFSD